MQVYLQVCCADPLPWGFYGPRRVGVGAGRATPQGKVPFSSSRHARPENLKSRGSKMLIYPIFFFFFGGGGGGGGGGLFSELNFSLKKGQIQEEASASAKIKSQS